MEFEKTAGVSAKVETINKDYAIELLKNNTHNRTLNTKHVKYLANQMSAGAWKFTADPIKISKTGVLLDGQHRLEAVVKSNTTQKFMVARNLADEIFTVLDTGKMRGAADTLFIAGFKNGPLVAALAKTIFLYEKMGRITDSVLANKYWNKETGMTYDIIIEIAENYYIEALAQIARSYHKKFKGLKASEYGFFYYLFTRINSIDAGIFFEKLTTGEYLTPNSAILALRKRLIDIMAGNRELSPVQRGMIVIKAWNNYRKGKPCQVLKINTDEQVQQPI